MFKDDFICILYYYAVNSGLMHTHQKAKENLFVAAQILLFVDLSFFLSTIVISGTIFYGYAKMKKSKIELAHH